ncbi:MAG: polysaccharide pyruvyl transferase family protein [Flavobacteriales bacterium]|nr:polysaccharide pyruvyl transferase family protein [Flavobacteriales bacterium]
MKLTYHEGQNFGDALNPLIFKKLFPDFFDDDERILFIGIGSILGLKKGTERTERRIYFSSGFAADAPSTYGTLPELRGTDDVICVRGPLTAKALGLPASKAIADGAILIKPLFPLERTETVTPFAYMPHIGSFKFFNDWKGLLVELGIALIDPRDEPMSILQQLQGTGVLLTEAMHGAIVADAMGVPWIPVVCYDTINAFKWQDFTSSMGLSYTPQRVPPLFDRDFVGLMVKNKMKGIGLVPLERIATRSYAAYQQGIVRGRVARAFEKILGIRPELSDRAILDQRISALLDRADHVRSTYGRPMA